MDISYKGTHYNGWQIQPNGKTIQGEIEKGLSLLLRNKTSIVGSGRTDSGVHARQQIAHFESDSLIDTRDLAYKLNSFLPSDIAINGVTPVEKDLHARFDAVRRTYYYHIHQKKDPFKREYSYYYNPFIDIELILKACEIIKDWENFECFSKVHTEVNNFNCEIYEMKWSEKSASHLFIITANRFLRGMVRAVVGTLLDISKGKISLDYLREILNSGDRNLAGRAVPAQGLYLEKVEYSLKPFNN